MLIMVRMELELMPDSDMNRFFEMGLELEFLIFLIDIVKPTISTENQEKKHIYLDANNLYGYAMSEFLPARGFKWRNPRV